VTITTAIPRPAGTGSRNGSRPPGGPPRSRRPSRRRRQLRLLAPLAVIALLAAAVASSGGSPAQPRSSVSVYPVAGDPVASPGTQIAFRGVSPKQLTGIVVRGTKSGLHGGRIEADSDHRGGSFLPYKPFAPGERVTVRTHLKIAGAKHGTFEFTVADPASALPAGGLAQAPRVPGDLMHFYSQPDLSPPAVEFVRQAPSSPGGDIFITPQQDPGQNGAMILSPSGQLVWFHPLPAGTLATDFRVQHYGRAPVLTWWQGQVRGGVGFGEDVVMNRSYRQVATIQAANGLKPDLHDFELLPDGTALITAYFPVWWNASSVKGARREVVLDSVVQDVELRTGLVRFQWDSLDQVPLSDSYAPSPRSPSEAYDYFHVNSVSPAPGGRLLISARSTWAVYELDPRTGRVVWTLGGKHSSFRMGPGVAFAFQHDASFLPGRANMLSLYDDGAGPPEVHKQSRALTIRLDYRHMTASLVRAEVHSPSVLSFFEGNVQDLRGGKQFVSWGDSPYFSEFDAHGRLLFDARFVDANTTYRAYVSPWRGRPSTRPSVASSTVGQSERVYASWNGATDVAQWRVLGGPSANSLAPVALAPTQGFETAVRIVPTAYLAVQALARGGRVLATSAPARSR
jgi:hypothetical protein